MGRAVREVIAALTGELIGLGLSISGACALSGYPRASYYRNCRSQRPAAGPGIHQRERVQPAALSDAERGEILQVLCRPEYADLSISQVFYRHLDAGCFIASASSWYRVARDHAMVGDRRRQARHRPRKIPELCASGPGQVWSWDITKLKGARRGQYWHLYVIVDIYSRYVVGWALHHYEHGQLAQDLIEAASTTHGAPEYLHSDNGAAMVSGQVADLAALLGVNLSFSRPKVSNDNPFSEALFKTTKYDLSFPVTFQDYQHALAYCEQFFTSYNTTHRHSGIGFHTPDNVHHGTTAPVEATRQHALDTAYQAHPERFTKRPRPPRLPHSTHINGKNTHKPKHLSHTG